MSRSNVHPFDALPTVDNVPQLFALATAMEQEAARRYDELTECMKAAGNASLARVFADLAEEERKHEQGISEWARRHGMDADSIPRFHWQSPESLSDEAIADAGGETLMTPLQALTLAVHNEERAFAFYVRIATEAEKPELRDYAERVANEELSHVALLRLERRRERRRLGPAPRPIPDTETLRTCVDETELRLQGQIAAAVRSCSEKGLEDTARQLEGLAAKRPEESPDLPASDSQPAEAVDAALRTTEALYTRLITTAEQAQDEDLVREAQSQAERVVARLAILGDISARLK